MVHQLITANASDSALASSSYSGFFDVISSDCDYKTARASMVKVVQEKMTLGKMREVIAHTTTFMIR